MSFNLEISIFDIVECASLLLIIIGGIFTFHQWCKGMSLKRAEYINNLTKMIRTDKFISETVYQLDYCMPWYNEAFHGSEGLELRIDKTLSYFSYICYLKFQRIITKKEFAFFEYEIKRILTNSSSV